MLNESQELYEPNDLTHKGTSLILGSGSASVNCVVFLLHPLNAANAVRSQQFDITLNHMQNKHSFGSCDEIYPDHS
jgi:hypothetical protein